ncbi:MAG: hypothetical protein ACR2N2_06590 [Acidimicrobiia bacterium]
MTETTTVIPPAEEPQGDVYKTVVRVVAGGIGEGISRLMAVSAELDETEVGEEKELAPFTADPRAMALIGWASELPALAKGVGESADRFTYPVTRVAGVAYDTTAYLAQMTGITAFVDGLTEPLRDALSEERDRLEAVGTAEYARGRVLATYAFEQSVGGIVGLLSESEELGELVREQTLGITGSAVQEIRETGAGADRLTEGIVRRLTRRTDRTLPPKPAVET